MLPETARSIANRIRLPLPRLIDSFTLKACIDALLRQLAEVERCAAKLAPD
jgi:hypothetical protein